MFIFCDETDYADFRILASVWFSKDSFFLFEQQVLELRDSLGFWEEIKSTTLNASCLPERVAFYKKFLKLGLSLDGVQIAAIRYSTDSRLCRQFYPGGPDQRDLSFLRLLIARKAPFFMAAGDKVIKVLHDNAGESNQARAVNAGSTFKTYLGRETGKKVEWVRPADSKICSALQMADLVAGLISYRLQHSNSPPPNQHKRELIEQMEIYLKRNLSKPSITPSESPFNLFLHRATVARLIQASGN